jgi:tetratricopeptide (TPR) repeat protein
MKIRFVILLFVAFTVQGYTTSDAIAQRGKKPPKNSAAKGKDKGNKKDKTLSDQDQREIKAMFMEALKQKLIGNYDEAIELFTACINKDPKNAACYYELSGLYDAQKRFTSAVAAAKEAATLDPKNNWYQIQMAFLFQKNGYYREAVDAFESIVKNNPEKFDYYYPLAEAYIYAGEFEKAIKAYDKIEARSGISEDLAMQKYRLYNELGKPDKAISEMQKLIDLNPEDVRAYGVLAELYEEQGMSDEALKTYQKILELEPENGLVHISLSEYYRFQGNQTKAIEELKIAFKNSDVDIDVKVQILLDYYARTEIDPKLKPEAYELARLLVGAHGKEAKSYSVYADFLLRDEKLEEAREQYRNAIKYDDSKFVIWNQVLIIDSQLNDFEGMYTESKEALELFPTQPAFYFFNGIAAIQKKQYQEAVQTLNTGKDMIIENPGLTVQFLQSLGDVYNNLGNFEKSGQNYDKVLELDPKNTYVLNNYSYFLSMRGEKLERAAEMSLKCNEIEPNQSSYQDTYAWILFKMENYSEAKTWMEKAIKNGGSGSGVILEHYGDVLFKVGETEKAFEQWQKAKATGKASDLIDKKIEDKKYYE